MSEYPGPVVQKFGPDKYDVMLAENNPGAAAKEAAASQQNVNVRIFILVSPLK